jgi:hypothetical protein
MDRDKEWRKYQEHKKIKKRIKSVIIYDYYYRVINIYVKNEININWISIYNKYKKKLKTSTSGLYNKRYYRDFEQPWKLKYNIKRSKNKEIIRKEVNDQIGERYHIKY